MANEFKRRPIINADENTWGPLEEAQNTAALSIYTSYIFNDSGSLKVTVGHIGINDGTNRGVCVIDTETTISIAGVTTSNWAYVLVSVSGSSVTFSVADIGGETDPDSFPATAVDALWNGARGGFYSSTNRVIGCIYKNSADVLSVIYNTNKQFIDNSFLRLPKFAEFNSTTSDAGYPGGWSTATIDATIRNEITGMSLASNQITCPAGRYKITGYCAIHRGTAVTSYRGTRIYDATNAASLILGTAVFIGSSSALDAVSVFKGIITLSETTLIELQVRAINADGSGAGSSSGAGDLRKIMFEKVG